MHGSWAISLSHPASGAFFSIPSLPSSPHRTRLFPWLGHRMPSPPPHKPWLQYTLVGRTNAFEPLARCLCRLGPAIRGPWAAAALAGSSPGRVRSSGLPDSGVALSTRRASSATTCSRSRPLALALWRVCWVAPMAPVRAAGRKPLGDMLCWCVRWPARTDAATPSASS